MKKHGLLFLIFCLVLISCGKDDEEVNNVDQTHQNLSAQYPVHYCGQLFQNTAYVNEVLMRVDNNSQFISVVAANQMVSNMLNQAFGVGQTLGTYNYGVNNYNNGINNYGANNTARNACVYGFFAAGSNQQQQLGQQQFIGTTSNTNYPSFSAQQIYFR